MNWLKNWLEHRRVNAFRKKIAQMKRDADAANQEELVRLMPAMQTISAKIRSERIAVIEKALEKLK